MVISEPPGHATPVWYPSKCSAAFAFVRIQRHLLVNRLSASPTAIGRISWGPLGMSLMRATMPPAKNLATSIGARPEARRHTTSLSEGQIGVGRWISAASNKCCMRSPEGPHAEALGKDISTESKSKSGGIFCSRDLEGACQAAVGR